MTYTNYFYNNLLLNNPMAISMINPTVDQKLDYQLYFLLRTYRWKEDEYIAEPARLAQPDASKAWVSYSQDEDKRLFRFDIFDSTLLELPQQGSTCWQMLRAEYQTCRVRNHATGQESQRDASAELLMGVAVVIVAENLTEAHTVPMTLRDSQGKELGQMLFGPKQTLFSLSEKDHEEASQFTAFQPRYAQPLLEKAKVSHWQLEWAEEEQWHLVPVRDEENDDNPIFAVYGVSGKQESLAKFAELLLYGEGGKSRNTVLMHLMSGLLMRDWQYSHIYAAASRLLDRLDKENAAYRSQTDEALRCTDTETLQEKLQAMRTLDAEAKHILGRIQGTIKTLQVNRENLPNRMDTVQRVTQKHGWSIDWQWAQDSLTKLQQVAFPDRGRPPSPSLAPALLEEFTYDIEELRNRQIYIEGALKHLEGSGMRWQVAIEERKMELSESFGKIGHVIIFLVALAEMGHAFSRSGGGHEATSTEMGECWKLQAPGDWLFNCLHWSDSSPVIHFITKLLNSPTVYLVFVILILLPVGKELWKVMRRKWQCRKCKKQLGKTN